MPVDKQRCERVAGLKFSDEAFAQLRWLADYCELYADPGAAGRRASLFMAPDFRPTTTERKQQALHELVAGVREVWRASGGVSSGAWYDMGDAERNGALVRLLSSLFEQSDVPPPSARTLRRAIKLLCN